tara:strand:+ start:193 stop:948 length:756 start_codon:yes stop_codon:yes gene_type:complete
MSRKAAIEAFNTNPTLENYKLITGGSNIGVDVGDPSLAKGKKLITRGDKTFVTDTDMPTGFLPRTIAGIQDIFQPGKDRDKRGQLQNPFKSVSEKTIGLPELSESDLTYSPVQKQRLSNALEDIFEKPKTALEKTEEGIEAYKTMLGDDDLYNQINKRNRDIALQNQMQYIATEPIRQAFANKAAEAAAQRGLRIRAAKEAMPSNIQNIMLSKQAQAATASSAEAERARAAADQQDAATRFAGLGMQRRFG